MIVLPVLLNQVLQGIQGIERRTIVLHFARDVLDACHGALDEDYRDIVVSYVNAAVTTLSDDAHFAVLVEKRSAFFRTRQGNVNTLSHRVGWVVNMAVGFCFLPALRAKKVVTDQSTWLPSMSDVAEEAQSVVAEFVIQNHDPDDIVGIRQARKIARWEVARSQLIRVIEVLPAPGTPEPTAPNDGALTRPGG